MFQKIRNVYNYFKQDGILLFMSILLIFITPIDYVLYVKWIDTMRMYNWYASSFIFPLFGIIIFFISTIYFKCKGTLRSENKIEQKPMIVMGIMDGLSSLLGCLATPYLSIIIMTILDKLSLPLLMLLSIIFLNTIYYKNHYLASFLTLYAICISYIPNFDSDNKDNTWWATLLYVLSIIPSTISYVLKQKYLHKKEINVYWVNLYICIYQFIFGIFMFPIMLIPFGKKGENYIPMEEISMYFNNATLCQFTNRCKNSLLYLFLYQIISFIANVLMLYIIQYGSSTYFVIINSLKIPIQAWLASYKNLVGNNYKKISINDLFCFVLLIVSTIVYNDIKEDKKLDIYNLHDTDLEQILHSYNEDKKNIDYINEHSDYNKIKDEEDDEF